MIRQRAACAAAFTTALLWSAATAAQQAPAPGAAYAIINARIVTLAGPVIERGTLVMAYGRIAAVGADVVPPAGATIIEGTGLEVYPGFFDSASQLGLTEIGAVAATNDYGETGAMNPQVVAMAAVHPASDHLPVARANGITHAVALPGRTGGSAGGGASIIGGQASAFSLAGWTVEEMALEPSVGLSVVWPTLATGGFDMATFSARQRPFAEVKKEYDAKVGALRTLLASARRYHAAAQGAASGATTRDLALEALAPILEGRRPLLVLANTERDIRNALAFVEQERLGMVLLGGAEAWRLKADLAARKIPVILGPSQALPTRADDPYDTPYARAAILRAAGVMVAMASFSSADSRNLPHEAGHAVAYGLPRDEALRAITLYPAQMLGLASEVGTIAAGKRANLVVTNGDPLEIRTTVKHVFVNGAPQSLSTRHTRLYETYRARPPREDR